MIPQKRMHSFTRSVVLIFAWVSASPMANGHDHGSGLGRPITAADAITMFRLVEDDRLAGNPQPPAYFSPDGKQFVVLLRRANLQNNRNEFSLRLFNTAEIFRSDTGETVLTMSSSSNRDAITKIKWLADNQTIVFLGEQPEQQPQVYALHLQTKNLERLTNHPTAVVTYEISPDGGEMVYVADPPPKSLLKSEEVRRNGILVTNQLLTDLIAGDCAESWWNTGEQLFIQKRGHRSRAIDFRDYLYPEANFLLISPNGKYAVIRAWVKGDPPDFWKDYETTTIHARVTATRRKGELVGLTRFDLLNFASGSVTPLLDTPMEWYNDTPKWTADGSSLTLVSRLPLDVTDSVEVAARRKSLYEIELKLPSRELRKIRTTDVQTEIKLAIDRARSKTSGNGELQIAMEEGLNAPPKLYAIDSKTGSKQLLLDLNPQFADLAFGRAETVSWLAADGHEVEGGLYLPPDYSPKTRYPLVIQTHGFDPTSFSIDGLHEWASAFAARPLAALGFVVLQVGRSKKAPPNIGNTPAEGPFQMSEFEGAIDYLDRQGIIDRDLVGISGFSRTVFYVAYTLTHSKYAFRAAVLADGIDAGYFEYIAFGAASGAAELNGGSPFGQGISLWLRNSPSFNLDKVRTPIRWLAFHPSSLLGAWEWYSALSLQKKPVELVYLPDSTHIPAKPWERFAAEQGLVDWFRFWLKGEEDPDPAKRDQYLRWRGMKEEPRASLASTR